MSDTSLLEALGIHLSDIVAGFSGGVVNAVVFKRVQPAAFVGSVIVGALTAAYIAPVIGHYTGTTGVAAAFVTGLAGMALCQGIVNAAKSWRIIPNSKGTTPDAN
jgi:FtsH-binding integral membrane protein